MAFSWAGAAAGMAEARRQQQQDAMAAAEFDLRRRALEAQLVSAEDARVARQEESAREAERQRLSNAQLVAGLLTPGPVTEQQAERLRDTPYGDVLLEPRATLPSTSTPGEAPAGGGKPFSVFTGTPQQRQEAGRRAALSSLTQDQTLAPSLRRFLELREAGVNLPNPESLISETDRDARATRDRELEFQDFERRERLQASLRPSPAVKVGTLVTAKDRVQARRWPNRMRPMRSMR